MASEYGLRGEAASRMRKGGKKGPPAEDLGVPPEDELAPEGEGEGFDLMALLGGGGAGAPTEPPPGEEPMPEEIPAEDDGGAPPEEEMAPEPVDLDSALGGVETALDGMDPESAEQIRTHLNAIREIAAQAGMNQEKALEGAEAGAEGAAPPAGADAGSPMPGGQLPEPM